MSSSQVFVTAIAKDTRLGVLAATKVDGASLGGQVFLGRESATRMGPIAEWLVFAVSAGTPVVTPAGFDGNGKR